MSTCSINGRLNEAKELLRLIGDRTLNSFACCLYLIDMGSFWEVLNLRYIGIAWFCRVPMYSLLGYIGISYFCWISMYPEYIIKAGRNLDSGCFSLMQLLKAILMPDTCMSDLDLLNLGLFPEAFVWRMGIMKTSVHITMNCRLYTGR